MKHYFHINRFNRVIIFIALFMFAGAGMVHAAKVTLTWDRPGGDVAGYRIYYGIDDGSDEMDMPGKTVKPDQTRCEISGLVQGQRYWFIMTYFNQAGAESPISEQLYYDVPVLDINNDGIKDAAILNSSGNNGGAVAGDDDSGVVGDRNESAAPDAPAEEPGNTNPDFVTETDGTPSDQTPASNTADSGGNGGGGGGGSCFIGSLSR